MINSNKANYDERKVVLKGLEGKCAIFTDVEKVLLGLVPINSFICGLVEAKSGPQGIFIFLDENFIDFIDYYN